MGASDLPLLRIGAALDAAQKELIALVDRHLPAAQSACATARASLTWVERVVESARAAVFDVPHYATRLALLLEVSTLDIEIGAIRRKIEELSK